MQKNPRLPNLTGQNRLIVALDVLTHEAASQLVEKLPNVSFFKVGLQLLMFGDIFKFLGELQEKRNGGVFVDLKLSGDIGTTITKLVEACMTLNVKFITLVESKLELITIRTLQAAQKARGEKKDPRLLMVPLLSSLDADDLFDLGGGTEDAFIIQHGGELLHHGCDGLIVSGKEIKACREKFPEIDIVSPGIRPAGSSTDDHKRHTTPREAIHFGADYLVVGRPITNSTNPKDAAQKIIDEVDRALEDWATEYRLQRRLARKHRRPNQSPSASVSA